VRVLCFGSEKSGKAEKNGQAQNQNINLAARDVAAAAVAVARILIELTFLLV